MKPTQFETAVAGLLEKAQQTEDFETRRKEVLSAIVLAHHCGMRVSRANLLPGVAGHYGRIDAARIAITSFLVAAVSAVVITALVSGSSAGVTAFSAPLSGLAGICLGWLFTAQVPSTLTALGGVDALDANLQEVLSAGASTPSQEASTSQHA